MVEIVPDLWIGNKRCIEKLDFLIENRFKCIINCSKKVEFNADYKDAENIRLIISRHSDPEVISFQENMDIAGKFDHIAEYIHSFISKNKTVLIFCRNCVQESPTIAAAYIIKYGKVPAQKAIDYIQSKRQECFEPNVNYGIALHKYEKDKTKIGHKHR